MSTLKIIIFHRVSNHKILVMFWKQVIGQTKEYSVLRQVKSNNYYQASTCRKKLMLKFNQQLTFNFASITDNVSSYRGSVIRKQKKCNLWFNRVLKSNTRINSSQEFYRNKIKFSNATRSKRCSPWGNLETDCRLVVACSWAGTGD